MSEPRNGRAERELGDDRMPRDEDLIAGLRSLGPALAYPDGRGIEGAVHARVIELPPPGRRRWLPQARRSVRRSLVLAVAALVLLAAIAAAVRFGVPGIRLSFGGGPSPVPSAGATPAPIGSTLLLGSRTTLAEARAAADFQIELPQAPLLGPPDAVFLDERIPGGHVATVWGERPDIPAQPGTSVALLLTQFRGAAEQDFFEKLVHGGVIVEPVTVGDARGWWLEGDPHVIYYLDRSGSFIENQSRFVGNALIWERDGVTYRLESDLDRAAAVAIAESLAPTG